LRGAQLVGVGLQGTQEVEGGVRGAAGEAALGDRAVGGGVDGHVGGVRLGAGVDRVEVTLAEGVGGTRAGEAGVEQHRPVRYGGVEFGEGRHAVLGPLVHVEAAHRGDPLSTRDTGAAPGPQRVLDLADRRRVLQDRVVAGPVGQAHGVDVRLDQTGNRHAAAEVDHAGTLGVDAPADVGEHAVLDQDLLDDGVAAVHGVDAAVHEREAPAPVAVVVGLGGRRGADRGGGADHGAGLE
jgi:hypothetical protein